jgi:membrane protein
MLNLAIKIQRFFEYDIWHMSKKNLSKNKSILIFYLRVLVLSIRGYVEDQVGIRASALTFFTLLSVIPTLAMGFGIAQGFGARIILQNQLKNSLEGHEEVYNYIITFTNSMLENTKGGWLAGIGIVVLLWSVIKVIWNIESSFNHIWQVTKPRKFIRKLSDYLSLIVVAPIVVVLSGSISIFILTTLRKLSNESEVVESIGPAIVFLLNLTPFILIWSLLTLLYMVMPNTNVKFKSAFIAAVIAGSVFQLVQWGYIHFQVGVSKYNAIYGSFAAFPLLLVFLQIAWLIVLFGAEISYSHQNVNNYEYEKDIKNLSSHNTRLACLAVLHAIVIAFEKGEQAKSVDSMAIQFGAPFNLVRRITDKLVESGLIAETEIDNRGVFLPSSDIHKMDLSLVLTKLSDYGSGTIPFDKSESVRSFNKKIQQLRKELKSSSHNVLIKDI